jgi:arylsulfatase A-like enzyme/Tfp pilus assembly protein PilF
MTAASAGGTARAYACTVLIFAALFDACGGKSAARPNILLITLDTTRADHLGAYGYARAKTPNLDRLAASGVLFERAITAAPLTLPAHASLLTGRYPFRHGVRNNGSFTLADTTPTLATAFHAAGYRTAAFVSAFVLDRRYGLARGFEVYDDRLELERGAADTVKAAGDWLVAATSDPRPFFVWVHLYDPHDPYEPPPPFKAAFADSPYDGEIAYADQQIGELLGRLHASGRDGSLVVAVAGDHGESLGEHGEATHGLFVYESAIRIPMTVGGANLPRGQRVSALVRGVDLAPTLLDAAALPPLADIDGRSLVPLARGTGAGPQDAYSETYFPQLYMNWAPLRSLQDARWKFIDAPSPELYDVQNDAGERANLAANDPARTATFRRAVVAAAGGAERPAATARVDRETAEKLAALGYIGAAVAPADQADEASRPDPKAMIDVFNQLRDANTALQHRQFAAAAHAARGVLARDRDNAFATMILARADLEEGRYREAADGYRRYATLVPASADAHHWRAIALSRLGDVEQAIAEEDAAIGLDANDADAHELRGGLLASRGRTDAAVADLRAAVALAPDRAAFHVGLARVFLDTGKLADADAEIRRALALQPTNLDALAAQASLLVAQGQPDAARLAFERVLAARPDADDVRLDYAAVLEQLGNRDAARAEFEHLAAGAHTPQAIRDAARRRLR